VKGLADLSGWQTVAEQRIFAASDLRYLRWLLYLIKNVNNRQREDRTPLKMCQPDRAATKQASEIPR
jgi:hypothetical protein